MVGARNILYKLSAEELRLTQTLHWHSLDPDRESCLVKGKTLTECQNYIKVLHQYRVRPKTIFQNQYRLSPFAPQDDPDRYYVCGTNAYKPQCR